MFRVRTTCCKRPGCVRRLVKSLSLEGHTHTRSRICFSTLYSPSVDRGCPSRQGTTELSGALTPPFELKLSAKQGTHIRRLQHVFRTRNMSRWLQLTFLSREAQIDVRVCVPSERTRRRAVLDVSTKGPADSARRRREYHAHGRESTPNLRRNLNEPFSTCCESYSEIRSSM